MRRPSTPDRLVLDAGALIALEHTAPGRRMTAILERVRKGELSVVIPAGVVGQVWRDGARQAPLARLVHRRHGVHVVPLDLTHAKAVGELLRRCSVSDVTDAHVVFLARTRHAPVISSDPEDLHAIDPSVEVQVV